MIKKVIKKVIGGGLDRDTGSRTTVYSEIAGYDLIVNSGAAVTKLCPNQPP